MLKFLVSLVLVTEISGVILGEPGLHFDHNTEYASSYDNYKPRDYHFNYFVSDPHTGDHKSQWEVKDKGVVRGGYSLLEPDGTTRIVEYIADDHGFRAVVKKLGTSLHPESIETHGGHPHPEPEIVEPVQVLPEPENSYHSYDGHVDNYANVLQAAVQHLEPVSYEQPIEIPHTVDLHGYGYQPSVYQQEQVAPLQHVEAQPLGHHIQEAQPIYHQQHIEALPHNLHLQAGSLGHHVQPLIYKEPEVVHSPLQGYALSGIVQGNHDLLNGGHVKILAQPQAIGYGGVSHEAILEPAYAHSSQSVHGLTGNLEDDSRYTNYEEVGHEGAYSEKVQKVVAAPGIKDDKKGSLEARRFVIYYPEESHK